MTKNSAEPNRELLELAAFAVGLKKTAYYYNKPEIGILNFPAAECITHFVDNEPGVKAWMPHAHDQHCAQMEADLMIDVLWDLEYVVCRWACFKCRELYKMHGGDRRKARRRASLRVAAKIGAYQDKDRKVSPEILK